MRAKEQHPGKEKVAPKRQAPQRADVDHAGATSPLLSPHNIVQLQRSSGNQAVNQLIAQRMDEDGAESAPTVLTGVEVTQGNGKGKVISATDTSKTLSTTDMGPCVAVCGYNGQIAFMIHSDSTGTGGKGRIDLITGLRALVGGIGQGAGFTLTLIGGSVQGTMQYLKREGHLPDAHFVEGGEADGAYITWNGMVAPNKRRLAGKMNVPEVKVTFEE
ncbi:hypothetical protein [Pseudonocardia xinjiangensis]|uniref:Uncharacterized protein n=1 Tax=Pseudonocardia xinjiangensis TaxID=75289 RepID=A0ABX1R8Q1_9PSEU|nr:hypothetical protein [Pseudonocardia xinjiangensis]NMH75566.1 hypothetical protein [Pseudonocardia xinjiangensis]